MKPSPPPRHPSASPTMADLLKAYRVYRQMTLYPDLLDEMRALFLSALEENGIADSEKIRGEALALLEADGFPAGKGAVKEVSDGLIDLYFSSHFDHEQAENYINLARKNSAFQNLQRLVDTEGVTFRKIRQALREFSVIPQGKLHIPSAAAEGVRVALIKSLISDQLPFIGVSKHHITIRDVDEMMEHTVCSQRRSGKIGGKAAGMFLAYKIVLPRLGERDPDIERYVSIPESFYFNSGVLSDFIDYNRLYSFHSQKYKSRELIEADYGKIAEMLEKASFPPDVTSDFRTFLENLGETPLILRSSSLLEDSIGYSFSGKYDSIFLVNQGDLQTRLRQFMGGLKRVLLSVFSPAAILYRRDHDLLDFDERMSVLVQKVVGRRFGPYFFPFAAGVAFSRNSYAWTPRIVREEGLVRLVLGLGTRAVDRVEPDYPRMVALSHPSIRPEVSVENIKKYSQKMVDVLNLESGQPETVFYRDLFRGREHPDLSLALSVDEEGYLSPPRFKGQEIDLGRSCITFDNFLAQTPFVAVMKKVLQKLQQAYSRPVDVEFAWDGDKLYLLQCRSLAVREEIGSVVLPANVPPDRVLFTNERSISNSIIRDIEYLVYVDPKSYGALTGRRERTEIGRVVGRINRILEGKRYALFGPVRWGTNDINYGVKVGYEDINRTLILGEIAFEVGGSTPEVSYGTHFFNDLVEAGITPLAIYPDEPGLVFKESFFVQSPNQLSSLAPDLAPLEAVVHVIHIPSCTGNRLLQVFQDGQRQKGMGFFAAPGEEFARP